MDIIVLANFREESFLQFSRIVRKIAILYYYIYIISYNLHSGRILLRIAPSVSIHDSIMDGRIDSAPELFITQSFSEIDTVEQFQHMIRH